MAQDAEIFLGNGWHTLYSDEPWYLIVTSSSSEIRLEGRFQSDAPQRTGKPTWAGTEFCISDAGEEAICRVPYDDAAHLLAATKLSFVPESIWSKAVEECRKLMSAGEGTAEPPTAR